MKVYELIQILCQNDPQTEVLATDVGFPPERGEVFPVECVYEQYKDGKKRLVLTTRAVYETKGHSGEGWEGI